MSYYFIILCIKKYLSMKKIINFNNGGCGFVGTNLAIYLQKELKNFSIFQ